MTPTKKSTSSEVATKGQWCKFGQQLQAAITRAQKLARQKNPSKVGMQSVLGSKEFQRSIVNCIIQMTQQLARPVVIEKFIDNDPFETYKDDDLLWGPDTESSRRKSQRAYDDAYFGVITPIPPQPFPNQDEFWRFMREH
jgi:dTDP-glucose pyrophosphorylase